MPASSPLPPVTAPPDRAVDPSADSSDGSPVLALAPDFYQAGAYGLDDSWAYLMRQVLSASLRRVADVLADQDLPSVQWMPLLRLAAGQRCTPVALARDLGVDAATMTRAVDKLVGKGWVARQRCDKDRRQLELRITADGQAMAAQLQPTLSQVLNAPLTGFSHADWQQLLSLLRRMKAASCQLAQVPDLAVPQPAPVDQDSRAVRVRKARAAGDAATAANAKPEVGAKPNANANANEGADAKASAMAPGPHRKSANAKAVNTKAVVVVAGHGPGQGQGQARSPARPPTHAAKASKAPAPAPVKPVKAAKPAKPAKPAKAAPPQRGKASGAGQGSIQAVRSESTRKVPGTG